jgi:signal transduction histidine kinase
VKVRRSILFWLALALCAGTVLGAMSWLTRGVLAAERERLTAWRDRAAAESRADLEERTRLALWRMDAQGAAVVLRENLAPVERYRPDSQTTAGFPAAPEVLLHFQIAAGRPPESPETAVADPTAAAVAGDRLRRLRELLAAHPLPGGATANAEERQSTTYAQPAADTVAQAQAYNNYQRLNVPADQLRQDAEFQSMGNLVERSQRARAVENTTSPNKSVGQVQPARDAAPAEESDGMVLRRQAPAVQPAPAIAPMQLDDQPQAVRPAPQAPAAAGASAPTAVRQSGAIGGKGQSDAPQQAAKVRMVPVPVRDEIEPFRPVWLGGELLLVRKVTTRASGAWSGAPGQLAAATVLQGVWLDAAILSASLLETVADLLPAARLVPATDAGAAADPLALVSFPFQLDRRQTLLVSAISTTPVMGAPLWVAWGGVLLAVLTSALLVRGVLRLSERRASFVSAVTHELRTPLTTFRLYSDMLEQDAVKPEKRRGYLRVLSREADRLSHLVENVLAFSRIERGNARSNLRETRVAEMLETFRERFEARLATAGLTLAIEPLPDLRLRADLAAVEHILFNLIDNAAKYATGSVPPVVTIAAAAAGSTLAVSVTDHGPGIAAGERRRIFRPFHKSAREAAETKPGVGLGLALSRRLARAQGGELALAETSSGTRFVLRLPAAAEDLQR